MKKATKKPARKTSKRYQAPKLATHGDVAKLTRRIGKFKPSCPGSHAFENN